MGVGGVGGEGAEAMEVGGVGKGWWVGAHRNIC